MSLSQEGLDPIQLSKTYQRLSSNELDQFIKEVNTSINAENLTKDLFGEQNFNSSMSKNGRLRFGSNGSMLINASGEYAGRFTDFERGTQGDLIQLVQREKNLHFKSALSYVSPYIRSSVLVQKIVDFIQGKNIKEGDENTTLLRDREAIDRKIQALEKKISKVQLKNKPLFENWENSVKEATRVEDETGMSQGILQSTPPAQDFIDIYRAEISDLEAERTIILERTNAPEALEKNIQGEKDRTQKIEAAKDIISKTVPIAGTPAEFYLINERGIKGELPESLRYLPAGSKFHYNGKDSYVRDGALAAVAKDSDGNPKAIQVTYLTKEGKRAETPDGEKFPKISYGSLKGTFVQLQIGGKELPITIAEGVETALSLKEAGVKGNILCSLGISNIKNIDLQNREIVIAADWDGSYEKESWKSTEKAKADLENKGNNVALILPVKNSELTNEKVDFNDLLKKGGVESVLARVSEQVPRPVTSVLLPRETKQNQKSKESIFLSDGSEGKRKPQTKVATLGRLETKPHLEKEKSLVSAQSKPLKSNPFKTNPFDFKSRSAEGRSR